MVFGRTKKPHANQWTENLPISSYENFSNTTVYELFVFMSYFIIQLAVIKFDPCRGSAIKYAWGLIAEGVHGPLSAPD